MKLNDSVLKCSFYRGEGNFFMKKYRTSLYKPKMVSSLQNIKFMKRTQTMTLPAPCNT